SAPDEARRRLPRSRTTPGSEQSAARLGCRSWRCTSGSSAFAANHSRLGLRVYFVAQHLRLEALAAADARSWCVDALRRVAGNGECAIHKARERLRQLQAEGGVQANRLLVAGGA